MYRELACVVAICFCVGAARPVRAQTPMRMPEVIDIPREIKFSELVNLREKDGRQRLTTIYPSVEYQQGFAKGWQDRLFRLQREGLRELKPAIPMMQTNSRYLVRGLEAGDAACIARVREVLAQGSSAQQVFDSCAAECELLRNDYERADPTSGNPIPSPTLTPPNTFGRASQPLPTADAVQPSGHELPR